MILSKQLDRYINNNEYKITITNNYININNYTEIKDFSSNKILIKNINSITIINGTNLVISKMLDNELLIEGNVISIEL